MSPTTSIPPSAVQAKACSICLTTSTSNWLKDPDDETKNRCRACYNKSRKDLERFCFTCLKTVKSSQWYKDPDDKAKYRCEPCYHKSRKGLERFCFSCQKTVKSPQWYKDPDDKTKDRCKPCYQKSRKDLERFCFICQKTVKSSRWSKDPDDNLKDLCNSCYNRVIYRNKKRKKSPLLAEDTLLNRGSSLENFQTIGRESDSKLSYESSEEDATTYLQHHFKRKINRRENSPHKLQCTTNFLLTNNTHLGDNLPFDISELDPDEIECV